MSKDCNKNIIAEAKSGNTSIPTGRAMYARGGGVSKSPRMDSMERVPGDSPGMRLDRTPRKVGGATKNTGKKAETLKGLKK